MPPSSAIASFSTHTSLVPRLLSYNTNSLSYYATNPHSRARASSINAALHDFLPSFDIICLQETNLSSSEQLALSSLPGCTISYNNYNMTSAGTLIIDTPSISRHYSGANVPLPLCCKGHVQLRRYTPKNALYNAFQILNVYLPTGKNKTALQTQIITSLLSIDPSLPSFLAGDFNFISSPDDSTNPTPTLPPAAFVALFDSLKDHLEVTEVPHNEHTHYHLTDDPTSPYSRSSRLDRVFAPSALFHSLLSTPTASIHPHHSNFSPSRTGPRLHFSDHLPVSLSFIADSPSRGNKPHIPLWLALSPEFASSLRARWRPPNSSTSPYKRLAQYKKALLSAAADARASRLLSSSTTLRLSQHLSLFRAISVVPQNLSAIEKIISFNPALHSLVVFRQGAWHDNGLEKATRDLHLSATPPSTLTTHPITALKDKLPTTKTRIASLRLEPSDPPALADDGKASVAASYWGNIWAPRTNFPPDEERATFLDSYLKKVDHSLLSPPLLSNIIDTITHSNNSTSGPDGIPFAAWRAAPDLAAPILLSVLTALCRGHPPPAGFNHGLLFLIPKKHTGLASDTRPISVTNTDNRLLATTMAHAIMPGVSNLVDPSQKGFLWGKNGLDHTVDINDFFFKGVAERKQRLIFFLDTAKAFDSIDHQWIFSVLDKAGFPPWVVFFIKNTLLEVKVAPFFGKATNVWIDILRGVKQGCPLSPLIFLVAFDPLLSALSSLPNIRTFAFADDLAISALSIPHISPALPIITCFSRLSGMGVNKNKSCVISSGPNSTHRKLLREIAEGPWPDLPLRPTATHLGVPIGRDITLAQIFETPYNKALSRLSSYKSITKTLSVPSRILLVNVFIISLFSYLFLFFVLPKEYYVTLKELIRKVVTPFNGGAYSYDSLVTLRLSFSIKSPLKDLWAFNVALLAARSPLISTTTNYNLLPAISLRKSKFIKEHRDAAAVDFWRDRHLEDGTLLPLSNHTSTAIYQALITDNYLPLAIQHLNSKINSFITKNSPLPPPPINCVDPISSALSSAASSLPASFLFHHFSLINNALATSRRMRHQNRLPLTAVAPCFFCGAAQDSIPHLLTTCKIIQSARLLFLTSLGLSPQFSSLFPLHTSPAFTLPPSFSFLIDTPHPFVIPTLVFNLAVWKYRHPALGSRYEQDDAWRVARTAELASTLFLRVKKRSPRKVKTDDSVLSHMDLLSSSKPNTIICYTDGSASPNPGPSGAGASIFSPNASLIDLGASLGHGSNNFAELYAIGMVFSELSQSLPHSSAPAPPVLLFTDSLYAIQVISSTKPPVAHTSTVLTLRASLAALLRLTPISLLWIRGHCEVGGNERVDRIAKRFANAPAPATPPLPFLSQKSLLPWPFPTSSLYDTPLHLLLANLPKPGSVLAVSPVETVSVDLDLPRPPDDSGLDSKHCD